MVSRVIISFASHVLFMPLLLFISPPFSHFISLIPVLSPLMGVVGDELWMRSVGHSLRCSQRGAFVLLWLLTQVATMLGGQTLYSYIVFTLIKI